MNEDVLFSKLFVILLVIAIIFLVVGGFMIGAEIQSVKTAGIVFMPLGGTLLIVSFCLLGNIVNEREFTFRDD